MSTVSIAFAETEEQLRELLIKVDGLVFLECQVAKTWLLYGPCGVTWSKFGSCAIHPKWIYETAREHVARVKAHAAADEEIYAAKGWS